MPHDTGDADDATRSADAETADDGANANRNDAGETNTGADGTDDRTERGGVFGRMYGALTRRGYLKAGATAAAAAAIPSSLADQAAAVSVDPALTGIRGAMYLPAKDWNAYQMWANYQNSVVESELDMAASLGLNSVRVLGSYYYWKEDGPSFFSHVEHFLTACDARGIEPIIVLFEAPPKNEPTQYNRTTTDPADAFGVHSPSRNNIIQPRDWSGWARSPLHFARRWAQEYSTDSRLLATEIMNEPGDVQPRQDFVKDMLNEVVTEAPADPTLTMGCKDFQYNTVYDGNDDLDIHQFHMNLPVDKAAADSYLAEAEQHRQNTGKPLWCTEWQRTREEPPNKFLPNYKSLASTMRNARQTGKIDGDFFWGLMLKPAYLQDPRNNGRVNGLFHSDGTPFDASDRDALAGDQRHYPSGWDSHPFPYPDPVMYNHG